MSRILITFGAIDADDCCGVALNAVRRALGPDVRVDVVVSRNAAHVAEWREREASDPRLTVHVDTKDMAALMQAADLAIGAGGTTSWERACVGLPALVAAIAENQRPSVTALEAAGCALAVDADDLDQGITTGLEGLGRSPGLLKLMGEAGRRLVDGRGATRVARAICPSVVDLREAVEADSRDLWSWRNDDRVRRASRNSDFIPWEVHRDWFAARLADPDCAILIGCEAGTPGGVLRFDIAGDEAVVSIYLVPGMHGRGLAVQLLRAGESWLRARWPQVRRIIAEVLPHNRASVAAFVAADYDPRLLRYERDLDDERSD